MKVIRDSIFETNSSSCHSIVYSEKYKNSDSKESIKYHIYNDVLTVTPPDIGYHWNPELLFTCYDKLCYLICFVADGIYSSDALNEELKNRDGKIPNIELLFTAVDLIKEKYNLDDVIIEYESNSIPSIDHQSAGSDSFFNDKITENNMSDYLFDSSYIVVVDNDNTCYYDLDDF